MVWGTQRVLRRHEASPRLGFDLLKLPEKLFLPHIAVLSLFQSEWIPVRVGLQQIETVPALPWHSWASVHGRAALQTFGSDFCRAATAKCAAWKTAEHAAQLIWLSLPFPSLPIPYWIYPGSKPAPEKPRQNLEMGKWDSAFGIFCALCLTLTDNSSSGHWFRPMEQMGEV